MAGTGGTSALIFGSTPSVATTESWDGTSWTEVADLALGRASIGGWGLGTAAGAAGGNPEAPSNTTASTEEFTAATIDDTIQNEGQVYYNTTSNTLKLTKLVFGAGAWSSGGNLNTARTN